MLSHAAWEAIGAILVGGILGLLMALLTGRVRSGVPTLAEALGFVFLCTGIALWVEVSFLIAAMVMGAMVANFAHHHTRPFHAPEGIEWPFVVIFFVLAGAPSLPEQSADHNNPTFLHCGESDISKVG